jgi:hypothetical protein
MVSLNLLDKVFFFLVLVLFSLSLSTIPIFFLNFNFDPNIYFLCISILGLEMEERHLKMVRRESNWFDYFW